MINRIKDVEKLFLPEEDRTVIFRIIYKNHQTGEETDGGTVTLKTPTPIRRRPK
jgi:hypothetical protein